MVTTDNRPDVGGNSDQADDGRDAGGRLPEPLDSAHFPPTEDGPAIVLPGMPLSQPAGTGAVTSAPAEPDKTKAEKKTEAGKAEADKPELKGGLSTENTPTRSPAKPSAAKTG